MADLRPPPCQSCLAPLPAARAFHMFCGQCAITDDALHQVWREVLEEVPPPCHRRLTRVCSAIVICRREGKVPLAWQFHPVGWDELMTCMPLAFRLRTALLDRPPGRNDKHLLGLPYFIDPTLSGKDPFELEWRHA